MKEQIENSLIITSLEMNEKDNEKSEWLSAAWHLKEIIDKGLLKGFSKKDYTVLKWINMNYNRARSMNRNNKDKAFSYWMFGDNAAKHLSDEGFERIKEIYNTKIK